MRITYVGELGWELYIPTEFAAPLFAQLLEAGKPFGLVPCGYHALDTLRAEKGYRHWGHDISPADTPLEAGLGFAVAWRRRLISSADRRSCGKRRPASAADRCC